MRVTEGGRHVELGLRHRPFPEHRVVRIEHIGLAPLAGEHRKRPTHLVHPVPLGQPSTTPVTALCGHSRGPGRSSTTSRLAIQPVWSRGARDSRLAIRSPRRHFAAGRHRDSGVPSCTAISPISAGRLSGTKPPRSGPVNRATRSEPTADLRDTFYLVVFPTFRGTSSFRKPSAKCFTRSARCPKSRRFSRCPVDGADWHKRCAGPMPAQWKRPRRVFRCCPAARHARRSTSPPLPRWVGEPARCAPYADHAPSHRTAVSGRVSRHHSPTAAPDPTGAAIPVTGTTVRSQSTGHEVQAGSFSTG